MSSQRSLSVTEGDRSVSVKSGDGRDLRAVAGCEVGGKGHMLRSTVTARSWTRQGTDPALEP